jgi:molybdopterin-binding protein
MTKSNNDRKITIIWVIMIIMTIQNFIFLSLLLSQRLELQNSVKSVVETTVEKKIELLQVDKIVIDKVSEKVDSLNLTSGKDGYTPIKYIDYFDGVNGRDGIDGIDGLDGNDGLDAYHIWLNNGNIGSVDDYLASLKGIDGQNGLTPLIRCNSVKNRWEVRYNDFDRWNLLNGEIVPCTVN